MKLIGCAGWAIATAAKKKFPESGTHLERYSAVFSAVEINSAFYRPHRVATYARWAASVPPHFRFSVKIPKEITHTKRLENIAAPLAKFLDEVTGLDEKLGGLLVQLPPSLAFDQKVAVDFFQRLTATAPAPIVLEPRHPSWFSAAVQAFLDKNHIARVATDPSPILGSVEPGGWNGIIYYRLHGSPRMYHSNYSQAFIRQLAQKIEARASATKSVWCIFDNTASGAALPNARLLLERLRVD